MQNEIGLVFATENQIQDESQKPNDSEAGVGFSDQFSLGDCVNFGPSHQCQTVGQIRTVEIRARPLISGRAWHMHHAARKALQTSAPGYSNPSPKMRSLSGSTSKLAERAGRFGMLMDEPLIVPVAAMPRLLLPVNW